MSRVCTNNLTYCKSSFRLNSFVSRTFTQVVIMIDNKSRYLDIKDIESKGQRTITRKIIPMTDYKEVNLWGKIDH